MIDSNVFVAAVTVDHRHHDPSFRYLESDPDLEFVTSIHCVSEFYSSATRSPSQGGSGMDPRLAAIAMKRVFSNVDVVSLTVEQHRNAVDEFANHGGRGPQLYDFLIGKVAILYQIDRVVTWNIRHFSPLFPTLDIRTPAQFLELQ